MTQSSSPPSVDGVAARDLQPEGEVLRRIGEALRGLRYGAVTVIVQDGVVVQVDRTEKLRLRTR